MSAQAIPINIGNTAFMLICASLVMLMTPGLAFFYGGLVGRKNVLSIMIQSFVWRFSVSSARRSLYRAFGRSRSRTECFRWAHLRCDLLIAASKLRACVWHTSRVSEVFQ